jgi:OLD-like protein
VDDDSRGFLTSIIERAARRSNLPLVAAAELALAAGDDLRGVVLVEGISDRVAVEVLAERRGRSLDGISVVPIGGTKSIHEFLSLFGPAGLGLGLAGLCDAGEERDFLRGLERAGLGANLTRAGIEALGFYVCDLDLEDELIRCLGTAVVEQVVEAQGDLRSFRILQKQPAQHGRSVEQQLRRFMGTRGGRKIHYARLLVEALDLNDVPRPLDGVLAHL